VNFLGKNGAKVSHDKPRHLKKAIFGYSILENIISYEKNTI
jgi:hypothetical protein